VIFNCLAWIRTKTKRPKANEGKPLWSAENLKNHGF
jgi:hypothetical protein